MDFPYTSHDSPTKKCPDVDQDSRNILSLFSQIFPRQSWAQFLCKAWLAANLYTLKLHKVAGWKMERLKRNKLVPGTFFCMEVCLDDDPHDDDNVDDEEEEEEEEDDREDTEQK